MVTRTLAAQPAVRWVATAAGYFALAWLSGIGEFAREGVPLVGFPLGVAFIAVQLGGPWLVTAVVVGAAGEGVLEGLPVGAIVLLAAAAASVSLAAYGMRWFAWLRPSGEKLRDTLIRTATSIGAAIVAASFDLAAASLAGDRADSVQNWAVLVLSNYAGIVVVGPFVRAWIQRRSRGVARPVEWLTLAALAIGVSTFADTGLLGLDQATAYLIFPVLIWSALRMGRMGATGVVLISALVALEGTVDGNGPFVAKTPLQSMFALNAYLAVLGLTGLLLSALEQAMRDAEAKNAEAEERHGAFIEQLPLVSYMRSLVDADAPPLFQSRRQTEVLLGYPLERWLAEPRFASKLVHPDDREANEALNARSLVEDVVQGEYRMIRADGRTVWVLDHMSVLRDAEGRPVTQQGFVVDISERKALEEQLGQAQRLEALGMLAGGIAHDFNNLLTAISGYAGLALDHGGRENERIRSDLAEVRAAADRAADLTRQLLAFSRRQVLARTVVDLNAVVIEARSLLERVIGAQVAIVTHLDPELVRVRADAGQLGQVLVNLAVNARDAMPDGGTLTITTSNLNGDAVVTVSDTGHGMDEQTSARIFEPFFSTKPVGEGSGLGLAMVHGIVQQTGGEISVKSAPGGTAFRIALPGTHDEPVEAAEPAETSPGGSETVLLVEDEDIVRRLVAAMLEGEGYCVVAAAGPEEALEVTDPYDLLLTDIVMPSMSGPELADRLIERTPGVGVLFISGYSGAAFADRGTLIADLLEKPFTVDQLTRKVREALDARLVPVP